MKFARNAQSLDASYIREILSAANQPEMISMAGGLPASSLLPVQLIRATCESLADNHHLFQYGSSQGYEPLIDTMKQQSQHSDKPWLICNGSQQALDLIARALLEAGDNIVAEVPAYLGALQVFQLTGATICPLNSDTAGPDLNQLEDYFKHHNVKLFYCVPDFHNPTGRVWPRETRIAVAQLCRDYDVTLIEDAPYRELRFAGEQLGYVSDLCPEISIRLTSFSKIGFPGLRVGAMNGPTAFITIAERIKQATDLHTGIPQQAIIHALLNHAEFEQHLTRLRRGYQERYQCLSRELTQQLGDQIQFDTVEGGMFVWLKLTQGDSAEIAARALQHNLAVVPGAAFYPTDTALENHALRLNFSNTDPALFPEAVARLAKAL
ncbi:PLP-dependent aminotransferase family protein [Amphritea sp. 1_MG-2023]|uniref:aminotransferase-like domain-containing protein n=1 Tax=Amphritea sp. 1_MG-2023 TaxID=3062670 RepID=UPI0026E39B7A|nr:PLP-dependent aminotransferase family protein [Amphritea sp. 1_MG-2023]MDO6563150.1 PLP-dependent aminotransferase family protein [Amphritea sp. 1_MG-2023]